MLMSEMFSMNAKSPAVSAATAMLFLSGELPSQHRVQNPLALAHRPAYVRKMSVPMVERAAELDRVLHQFSSWLA